MPNPYRTYNDWTEDPWADPEVSRKRRIERNERWVASMTERDWERLSDLVAQVAGEFPARLDDLDAPIAVGACPPDWSSAKTSSGSGSCAGRCCWLGRRRADMRIKTGPSFVLDWLSTLAKMKQYGTILMWSCQSPSPFHETLDVDELIANWGPEAMLFNERPPRPVCERLTSFLVSPGPGTPFRPLLSRDRGPDPRRPPGGWPEWLGPTVL